MKRLRSQSGPPGVWGPYYPYRSNYWQELRNDEKSIDGNTVEDEMDFYLMPPMRTPRMENRTSSLCLPPANMLTRSPSLMNRSTSLRNSNVRIALSNESLEWIPENTEEDTPPLFKRRNPLLARVPSQSKIGSKNGPETKERWFKIRKLFFSKENNAEFEEKLKAKNTEQGTDDEEVCFMSC